MKNPAFFLALALLLQGASAVLFAQESEVDVDLGLAVDDCVFTEPPVIPDGLQAPRSEVAAAADAVRGYVSEVEQSLACLDKAQAALGEEITPEQLAALNALYNKGVEQLEAIADSFNQQLRLFNARFESESASESE